MASFYVPLCVMVVVYFKILRVVADKKKTMSWNNDVHRVSSSVDANSVHVPRNSATPLLQQMATNGTANNNLIVALNNGVLTTSATGNGVAIPINGANGNNNNAKEQNGVHFFPQTTLHKLKKGQFYLLIIVI